jgi:hypothetical protein
MSDNDQEHLELTKKLAEYYKYSDTDTVYWNLARAQLERNYWIRRFNALSDSISKERASEEVDAGHAWKERALKAEERAASIHEFSMRTYGELDGIKEELRKEKARETAKQKHCAWCDSDEVGHQWKDRALTAEDKNTILRVSNTEYVKERDELAKELHTVRLANETLLKRLEEVEKSSQETQRSYRAMLTLEQNSCASLQSTLDAVKEERDEAVLECDRLDDHLKESRLGMEASLRRQNEIERELNRVLDRCHRYRELLASTDAQVASLIASGGK